MTPYYQDSAVTIYHGNCRDVLPGIAPASLVVADPPYHGVLAAEWDNQWADDADFLAWSAEWLAAVPLASNGSLYVFCSPRLSARMEVTVGARFNVIGSLVWDKGERRMGAAGSGVDVTALRTYWHAGTERIVFAETGTGDDVAHAESGYWAACEQAKVAVFGDYLRAEMGRAGVTAKQIAALFPSRTGGLTGCVFNWLLGLNCPTPEQYATIRDFLNMSGDDYLRREYDYLRREYEDLRRPFFLTPQLQWGNVWRFDPPRSRHHPAEKPVGLIGQIVAVSSRSGDAVLDPFMGSGTTLVAAKNLGRKAIGIEIEERYCEIAAQRCSQEVLAI